MNALWDAPNGLSATELGDRLLNADAEEDRKALATTTLLTVLSRLENKGFVSRTRATRPHRYSAVHSRAEHTADLMHQVLGLSPRHGCRPGAFRRCRLPCRGGHAASAPRRSERRGLEKSCCPSG